MEPQNEFTQLVKIKGVDHVIVIDISYPKRKYKSHESKRRLCV